MTRQRNPRLSPQPDALLSAFLGERKAARAELKNILRTRDFAPDANVVKAIEYLGAAGLRLPLFQSASAPEVKHDFLKSLIHAWEIADATGTFNSNKLKTWSSINSFSISCLDQIGKAAGSRISEDHKYWQEVARAGLIHIAELYRAQKTNRCIDELGVVLNFVETSLKGDEIKCAGLLGQVFYFLSKANRNKGSLDLAEVYLLQAMNYYGIRTERLVREARELEKLGSDDSSEELIEIKQKLVETRLRTGVVEVSRAWLYFSQCNFRGAKHSAQTALLLLSASGDDLTQYHARLVSAAVDRVTSSSAHALDRTVIRLTEIREYFRTRNHTRLQARTEYELLLALILLDSTLQTASVKGIKNTTPLNDAQKYLRQRFAQQADRWASLRTALHGRLLRHEEMKKPAVTRDFQAAISKAKEALNIARTIRNVNAQIDALIVLGEALIEQDDLTAAKRTLSEALHLCNKANFPELTAIVRLLLARIAVRENTYDEADYHLHQFDRIPLPDHAWIQQLHRKVFSEFRQEDHLVLQESQFTKREAFLALKKFLIQKAEKRASEERGKITEEAVAKLIGIERDTLTAWRRQTRIVRS